MILSYISFHLNGFYDKIFIQLYIMYFCHSHTTVLFLSLSVLGISFYPASPSSKEDVFKHANTDWCWSILCCYSGNPRIWQFIKNRGYFSQSWRLQIQTVHGLFVLVINSESPTIHYCHIKEKIRAGPLGVQSEFSTLCSSCLPFSVCCMNLNLCLSEDCCVSLLVPVSVPVGVCVCFCACLLYELYVSVSNKGPFSIFIEQLGIASHGGGNRVIYKNRQQSL